jgi:hypothetical protein
VVWWSGSHKAKNLYTVGRTPSKSAQAVVELQQRLPNSRVVYCSATGATEPRNLGYMTRLGLWGIGTPFPGECAGGGGGEWGGGEGWRRWCVVSEWLIWSGGAFGGGAEGVVMVVRLALAGGFMDLLETVEGKSGVMELVAMYLKQNGVFCSRTLSFEGCSFSVVEAKLSPDMEDLYDKVGATPSEPPVMIDHSRLPSSIIEQQ